MEFVTGLSLSPKKKDSIWVIIERLMKSAHFILIKVNYSLEKLIKLYILEIARLHGVPLFIILDWDLRVPLFIILDWDLRFTSKFWGKFHKALGISLNFSTIFHSRTDGQSKRIIQVLEDM